MPPIPIKLFEDASLILNKDKDRTYGLNAIFSGIDLEYELIKNPLDSYISNMSLYLIEDQRGYSYDVHIQAKNISKTLIWKVNITEDLPALPTKVNNDIYLLSNNYVEIDFQNILLGGKHLKYSYDIEHSTLDINIPEQPDFFKLNKPYIRYHSKNYDQYLNKVLNTGTSDDEILDFYKINSGIYNNELKLESNEEWSIVIRFKFNNPFGGYSYLFRTDTGTNVWYYGSHNRFRFNWSDNDNYITTNLSVNWIGEYDENNNYREYANWCKIIIIRNKTNTLFYLYDEHLKTIKSYSSSWLGAIDNNNVTFNAVGGEGSYVKYFTYIIPDVIDYLNNSRKLDNNNSLNVINGKINKEYFNNLTYVYGDKDSVLEFQMPNTINYTICALIKYNGNNKGSILGDENSYIGHWNGMSGIININGSNLTNVSTIDDNNDWTIILYNNLLESNNIKTYPKSVDIIGTTIKSFHKLYINKEKNSDWALADLLVFDKNLSIEDTNKLFDYFKNYLLGINNELQVDNYISSIGDIVDYLIFDNTSNNFKIQGHELGLTYNLILHSSNIAGEVSNNLNIKEINENENSENIINLTNGKTKINLNYILDKYNNTNNIIKSFKANINNDESHILNTEDLTLTIFPIYRNIEYKIILKYENPIYNDITHNNAYDYYLNVPGTYPISPNLNTNNYWSFYTRIKLNTIIPRGQSRYIVSGTNWGVYLRNTNPGRIDFLHHTKNPNSTIFFEVGGGHFIFDLNKNQQLIITRNDNHLYIYMYDEETKEIRKGYLPYWAFI